MERLTTSIISLFVVLSFVNAKANDVPRQNEDIIANYSLDEDDTLRYSNHYLFERAYNVIEDMLTDKRPVDFKKAVFAVENAFYDGELDSVAYYGEIARIGKGIKALAASPAVNAPTRDMALNYSIYLFYTQPMALNKGKPYYYDEQSLHDSLNLEYGLISRLLTTGKGTCHSMPFLYRILADEVGAKAYIVSVPLHYFIRTQNEKGNWFNFESTTGTFSRNEYYIESYHVNDSALQSGLYMSNLTDKGNLVQCLYDLLNIYEKKTGFFSNSFVRRCYTLGLKYRPNDNLRLWELEDIHYQLKKKAWHKGHKNNNDVMADDELCPERLRLREKELELLRIGYHRFTATEYAERYHAALDYCRDRQSKVAHFLTVDPKADQYPGINPYLYCAGNPIRYVDPTGMYVNKSFEKIDDDHYKYIGDYRIAKAVESAFEKFPNNTVICAHGNSNFIRWWHFKDSYGLYTTTPDDFKYHCLVDDNYNNILQEIGDSKCSIIILMSCETGKGDDNIAKKISAEMPNTIVIAPSEKVWVFPNGDIKVGTGKLVFDKTTGKPVLNEKGEQKETFDKLGLWKMYFNGKERTNFTGLPVFRDKTVEGYINKFKQEDENK